MELVGSVKNSVLFIRVRVSRQQFRGSWINRFLSGWVRSYRRLSTTWMLKSSSVARSWDRRWLQPSNESTSLEWPHRLYLHLYVTLARSANDLDFGLGHFGQRKVSRRLPCASVWSDYSCASLLCCLLFNRWSGVADPTLCALFQQPHILPPPDPSLTDKLESKRSKLSKALASLTSVRQEIINLRTKISLASILDDTDEVKKLSVGTGDLETKREKKLKKVEKKKRKIEKIKEKIKAKQMEQKKASLVALLPLFRSLIFGFRRSREPSRNRRNRKRMAKKRKRRRRSSLLDVWRGGWKLYFEGYRIAKSANSGFVSFHFSQFASGSQSTSLPVCVIETDNVDNSSWGKASRTKLPTSRRLRKSSKVNSTSSSRAAFEIDERLWSSSPRRYGRGPRGRLEVRENEKTKYRAFSATLFRSQNAVNLIFGRACSRFCESARLIRQRVRKIDEGHITTCEVLTGS